MVALPGQIEINHTNYDSGCLSLDSMARPFKMLKLRLIVPYGSWSIWECIKCSQPYSRPLCHILKVKGIISDRLLLPELLNRVLAHNETRQAFSSNFKLQAAPISKACGMSRGWRWAHPWGLGLHVVSARQPRPLGTPAMKSQPLLSLEAQRISETRMRRSPANVPFLLFGGWW